MNYMEAWREGHKEGMQLTLQLINEFTGQDFKTASEVVLHIKELELDRQNTFHKEAPAVISEKEEKMMNSMAQKIAINNWLWSD
jgi:hypothetical protein